MACQCRAELAALERRIEALEAGAGSALTAADRAFLAQLLPVIAGELGGEPWTLAELRQRPNVRLVIGSRSPASLGQLLSRAAGQIIGGLELEKLGRHGSRTLWRLWARAG